MKENLEKMPMLQMAFEINQRTKFYPNRTIGKYSNLEGKVRGEGGGIQGMGVISRKKYKRNKFHPKINLHTTLYLNRTMGKSSKRGGKRKGKKEGSGGILEKKNGKTRATA